MIDGECRAGHHVLVIYVSGNADDAARSLADINEVHHRIGPHDVAIDRILPREDALRQALADDHNRLAAAAIVVIEIPSGNNGHAESGKESGRNNAKLCAWVLLSRAICVTFAGEIEAWAEDAGIAPRTPGAEPTSINTG